MVGKVYDRSIEPEVLWLLVNTKTLLRKRECRKIQKPDTYQSPVR